MRSSIERIERRVIPTENGSQAGVDTGSSSNENVNICYRQPNTDQHVSSLCPNKNVVIECPTEESGL